jgi:hypothetical protein
MGRSVLAKGMVTDSGCGNVDSVVSPDSTPCDIEGLDGAEDGSAGLISCSGSLWWGLRASWA